MTSEIQAQRRPSRPRLDPAKARRAALVVLLVGVAASTPAMARMYRYVDENGVTVYSQLPPPSMNATEIAPPPGPSDAESEAAQRRLQQQLETFQSRRTEQQQAAQREAEEAERAEVRTKNCRAARSNLETLNNLGASYLNLPDGRTLIPKETQRRRLIEDARGQVRDNCD